MRKTLKEIAYFFGQKSYREGVVCHVACDSRMVEEGSLFFALEGENNDGHLFLRGVAEKGGSGAVVSTNYRGRDFGLELIRVEDVTQALQALARHVFRGIGPYVIGVTGSVGKTATKEWITTLLSEKIPVAKNSGNMNSQVGLPLTLLNWAGKEKVIVLEMGMSRAGELRRLVEIAPPDLGVLTNIDCQHAISFADLEGIACAKCEMFALPKTKRGIFHLSTKEFSSVRKLSLEKTWYHLNDAQADYTLNSLPFALPFVESHFRENILAAVAVARSFGLSWSEVHSGTKKLRSYDRRFQKKEKRGVLFIDDTYNASPLSVKAALENLPQGRRRIGMLGAMRELGFFEREGHREVAECALKFLDTLICIGKECRPMVEVFSKEKREVVLFDEKEPAAEYLKSIVEEGDVVLIKGGNSMELWTIIEEI